MRVTLVTTKKITAKLGEAVDSTNPSYVAEYADHGISFLEGTQEGDFNGTTDVDMITAPAAATQRVCRAVSIYNPDTIQHRILIQEDSSGVKRTILDELVNAGQTLYFIDGVVSTSVSGTPFTIDGEAVILAGQVFGG